MTGLSVEDLAREIHAAPRYIRALEEGQHPIFSAKVYAQGVLRQILRLFEIRDPQPYLTALDQEWLAQPNMPDLRIAANDNDPQAFPVSLNPRRLGLGLAAAAGMGLIVFWLPRLIAFSSPPRLTVTQPAQGALIHQPTVEVAGQTEQESRLTMNGRELTIDELGNFGEKIELQLGSNRMEFVSESKFGKISREVMYILVE